MRLIQITDLHLSDRTDTPAADALRWAICESNRLAPALVAVTGDMTTYGTAQSAHHFLSQASELLCPWVFTPGNAEHRDPGALPALAACSANKSLIIDDVQILLPDTSTGRLSEPEKDWLSRTRDADLPCIILTHYPMDVLDTDSAVWIESWLAQHRVEMYLAGHRHFDRSRLVGDCQEIITRGLDPDKAFGGPPGISLFERGSDGRWSTESIPWPHAQSLKPAAVDHSPVGWSIHGDPLETVRETRETALNVLELRPRETDYDLPAIKQELTGLRGDRPVYLSWHLPNLIWDRETKAVKGASALARQIEHGRECAVDSFTVHVPKILAASMYDRAEKPTAAWAMFLDEYERLFRDVVAAGIRVSIENIHNQPGTPVDRQSRGFATEIGEFIAWIDAVTQRIGDGPGRIGAHFDVGHARNNGELGNKQPIGDWYARVGSRITGYHIHQVRPHEETGKLTNHRDILSAYDRTVSYAGFLHAWSQGLINREPLFIEVRIAEERRRTVRLFEELFS